VHFCNPAVAGSAIPLTANAANNRAMNSSLPDLGLTHIALAVRDLAASSDFYCRFGGLHPIHDRRDGGQHVQWLADGRRRFALVLIQQTDSRDTPLGPFGHIGIACASRADVDTLAEQAGRIGHLRSPPRQSPPPIGYWALLADPDGNTLELSFGQHIEFAAAPT
jgi:catechol 2,3-dioxygenase-like lactoylglutathione lyase family enzyme